MEADQYKIYLEQIKNKRINHLYGDSNTPTSDSRYTENL